MASAADPGPEPPLDKERHVKYWQRCYGSYLPSPYTASDSTRLTWACFIVSALDLLSAPPPPLGNDRAGIRAWVLGLQHPGGGFCGSPAHAYAGQGAARGDANLAATFFALILLATTAEGEGQAGAAFRGVDRGRTLRWLARLQRADGSFGQNLWEGEAVGGRDMRHSYLAACVRWMLRGDVGEGDEAWEPDINVETMVGHIRRVQTYDGGLSESSKNESHAGYAYCAIGALALLDRPSDPSATPTGTALEQGIGNREALLKFLAGRQFAYQAQAEEEAEGAEEEPDAAENVNYIEAPLGSLGPSTGDNADEPSSSSSSSLPACKHVGYNGRWNKKADTCYYWWVAGTLAMLGRPALAGGDAGSRRFVLEVTQHRIGGFAKNAGGPPDIYHSYLGLAALATAGAGREGLKAFDVGLCCTRETTAKIVRARDGLLEAGRGKKESVWRDDGFWG